MSHYASVFTSAETGHVLQIRSMPEDVAAMMNLPDHHRYDRFYVVALRNAPEMPLMYLGREGEDGQVVIWYAKSRRMHHSYRTTLIGAVEMAQKDGWLFA